MAGGAPRAPLRVPPPDPRSPRTHRGRARGARRDGPGSHGPAAPTAHAPRAPRTRTAEAPPTAASHAHCQGSRPHLDIDPASTAHAPKARVTAPPHGLLRVRAAAARGRHRHE